MKRQAGQRRNLCCWLCVLVCEIEAPGPPAPSVGACVRETVTTGPLRQVQGAGRCLTRFLYGVVRNLIAWTEQRLRHWGQRWRKAAPRSAPLFISCALPIALLAALIVSCAPGFGPEPTRSAPTATDTPAPTAVPTALPTDTATAAPTHTPTAAATNTPTTAPSDTPTVTPRATVAPLPAATGAVSPTAAISGSVPVTDDLRVHSLDATLNILLLGSDQRPGDGTWRTDTIMVAAVDWKNERIGLVSIPRDLWVNIAGYGDSRINMADFVGEKEIKYPGGGPALLGRVISETLGIRTDRFARMNLLAFEQAIDTIGGVSVTLDCPLREATPDPNNPDQLLEVYFEPGTYHFDGHEARMYASYRYYTGDWDRSRRQQQVLLAIRQQALSFDIIPKIPALWATFSKAIQTDLSLREIFDLTTFGLRLDMKNVHGKVIDYRLVTPYKTPGGAQVLVPKRAEIVAAINGIFDTPPMEETSARPAAGCKTIQPTPTVVITATATITPSVPN